MKQRRKVILVEMGSRSFDFDSNHLENYSIKIIVSYLQSRSVRRRLDYDLIRFDQGKLD